MITLLLKNFLLLLSRKSVILKKAFAGDCKIVLN